MNWLALLWWAVSCGLFIWLGLALRRERELAAENVKLLVQVHDSEVRFDQLEQALRKLRRTEARDRVLGIIESNRSF